MSRIYTSITQGVPSPPAARVSTNILRDAANRLRMTTAAYGSGKGRTAASNYQLLQVRGAGGQWWLRVYGGLVNADWGLKGAGWEFKVGAFGV